MIIRQEHQDEVVAAWQTDFLVETIFDWYALYQRVYGSPAKIAFETAWKIGDEILARFEDAPLWPSESPAYELIHEALLATEKGLPVPELDTALATFFDALPSVEAGFVLFRAAVMTNQSQVES